jgi:hypothetical protein
MLRCVRMVGLCFVAVCVVGVGVAGSAFAEGGPGNAFPGYFKCVKAKKVGKAYTGVYGEKECLTRAVPAGTGKYELEAVKSGQFEGKSKVTTLTTHTKKGVAVVVVCKKDKTRGTVVAENEVVSETITFEDCTIGKEKCGNVGPETIETAVQEGELVWLNEAGTEAGLLLVGEHFATFKCGAEEVEVNGFVEGSVSLAGKKGPTITFAVNGAKEQADKSFWFGGAVGPFDLYTEATPGEPVETTLASVEAQKGPGGVY